MSALDKALDALKVAWVRATVQNLGRAEAARFMSIQTCELDRIVETGKISKGDSMVLDVAMRREYSKDAVRFSGFGAK